MTSHVYIDHQLWMLVFLLIGSWHFAVSAAPVERLGPAHYAVEPIEQARELNGPLAVSSGVYRLSGPVRFKRDGLFITGNDVTIDLAGHTLYYGEEGDDCWGIRVYTNWLEADQRKLAAPQAPQHALRARIINGVIVHVGTGARCHAICGNEGGDARIERVTVEANGRDTSCVSFPYGRVTVAGCVLKNHQDATDDRHMMPANVRLDAGCQVTGCILIGGNSGVHIGDFSRVDHNLIAQRMFATNGYAVASGAKSVIIQKNVIIPPVSGRGIISGGGEQLVCEDNVILAWNLPNEEYGWGLNACGVRVRIESRNYLIRHNSILAVGGLEHTSCSGIYLTDVLNEPENRNRYEFNDVTAILCGPTSAQHDGRDLPMYAKAITFEGQGGPEQETPISDLIRGNSFSSNHILISTTGSDGGCNQGEPLIDNVLSWTNGQRAKEKFLSLVQRRLNSLRMADHPDAVKTLKQVAKNLGVLDAAELLADRSTFYSGDWGSREFITLLDTRIAADTLAPVTFDLADIGGHLNLPSPRRFRIGDTMPIVLQNSDGAPLIGAAVIIRNQEEEAFSTMTDPKGRLRLPVIRFALERPGVVDAPFQKTTRDLPTLEVNGYKNAQVTQADLDRGTLQLQVSE
jgi:hypothetical protein